MFAQAQWARTILVNIHVNTTEIAKAAQKLLEAQSSRMPIPPLTSEYPRLSARDAYAIQQEVISAHLSSGAQVIGYKIGLTSVAMQQMLKVDEPDYGPILDTMKVQDGAILACGDFIAPKLEAEIAFLLKKSLRGPGVDEEVAAAAIGSIFPSIEIIDSRIAQWEIKLADTIADHASCARVVLSDHRTSPDHVSLPDIQLVLQRNGEPVAEGRGSAVLGNPAVALAWAANKLGSLGITLEPGSVIMPGALHRAITPRPGDEFCAIFAGLGSVSVSFEE